MRHLYLASLIIFAVVGTALGQQLPQLSQYNQTKYFFNPAAAGADGKIDAFAGYRNQWTGLDGAPVSYFAAASFRYQPDRSFKDYSNPASGAMGQRLFNTRAIDSGTFKPSAFHGFGGIVLRDQTGPFARTNFFLSYAYHMPLGKKLTLAAGAGVGFNAFALDGGSLGLTNDAAVKDGVESKLGPDVNAGLYLYSKNLYLGVGAYQLVPTKLDFGAENANLEGTTSMHLFSTLGYNFELTEKVGIMPSLFAKIVPSVSPSLDANVTLNYNKMFWFGLGYRNDQSLIANTGLRYKNFKFGYAFDQGFGRTGTQFGGSHELILGLLVD